MPTPDQTEHGSVELTGSIKPDSAAALPTGTLRRPNILLVDDNPKNLLALEGLLSDFDCGLITAASGAEALRRLLNDDFAVILMDVQMPGMNGFETAELIRAREKNRLIPLIFLTAFDKEDSFLKMGYAAGAVDYVVKPFQPEILRAKVQVFVDLYLKTERLQIEAERNARLEAERTLADAYASRLQASNEELSAANEELQAQAEELSAQALKLQSQQEELHAVYEKLRAHNEVVEAEVEAATRELRAQKAVQKEQLERLERLDRYKDEFLSVISHELRTPLNFIMGFASILEDDESLSEEHRPHVERILNGADRMLGLVEDLLDIARIQAGKVQIFATPTPYAPLVEEVIASLAPLAQQKDITLSSEVDAAVEAVFDAPRITQVLTNLVGNAIKFTPAGGQVHVVARPDDAVLLTEVIDTGEGIPESEQARVFEKFQQLDMSNTRAAGGAGLGLPITRALVEAHGGQIGVRGARGGGSTFYYTLPMACEPEEMAQASG